MNSYIDIFEREEMKYKLSREQHELLLACVAEHLQPSEYGKTQVRSLYYDTPEFYLTERSLDKPFYKEKLRLRCYGQPREMGLVFLGIKKKFDGIVYKRRVGLSLAAVNVYLDGVPYTQACKAFPLPDAELAALSLSEESLQISREIDFFIKRYGPLEPRILTVCQREAFVDATNNTPLRITFDCNLMGDAHAQTLRPTSNAKPLTDTDECIMEIKDTGGLPFWLVHALSEAKAYPQSFSKVGTSYLLNAARSSKSPRTAALPSKSVARSSQPSTSPRTHANLRKPPARLLRLRRQNA